MKRLWNLVNKQNIKTNQKNFLFLLLCILGCAIAGAVMWLIVGRFYLPKLLWLLCFIGYPAVFGGYFGGMIYLYRHDFEDQ